MKATISLALLLSGILTISAMAQAVEKKVALRNVTANPQRYATMVSKGGLNISSREVTDRQVFTLVDSNGGDLADGDEVQIKYGEGKDTSYWQETDGGQIKRDRKSSTFKVKKAEKGISLQAPSGKFVSAEYQSDNIPVTDASDKAAVFEVVENPTVKEAAPKAASSATTGETKE